MLRNRLYQTFAFVLLVLVTASCKKEEPVPPPSVSPVANQPEYFGFTLVDVGWDDPTDGVVKTNYADEVHSFSNLADILVYDPSQNIDSNLQLFDGLEMKALLHLHEIFFEAVGAGAPSGTSYALRADYQARWDQFVAASDVANNADKIASFYIGEEPTWNGISANDLKLACDYVDAQFPNIPISIVEAFPILDLLEVPESADWIGFDHYFIRDPNIDSTYQQELDIIQSKINENQHLLIVMDAHYIDWAHFSFGGIEAWEMEEVAYNYYTLAQSKQNAIAVIAYFWPSGFDDPNSLGARALPSSVQSAYEFIGGAITGK